MIITISGKAGAGKSTLGKLLEGELKIPRIYVGKIRRELAKKKGMTLAQFNKWSETNPKGDVDIDKQVIKEAKKYKDVIIEGRVMYHFFPKSIKIFLDIDDKTAAQRIFEDLKLKNRNEDTNLNTINDVIKSIKQRKKSDDYRYKKYYNIDINDKSNFDLIIDTTNKTKKELLNEVIDYIKTKF